MSATHHVREPGKSRWLACLHFIYRMGNPVTTTNACAHEYIPVNANLSVQWMPAQAPDIYHAGGGRMQGRLRCCSFCGSMDPAELAAALRAGACVSWADWKYGWPHKLYVAGIPNPHAGLLEITTMSSEPMEDCVPITVDRYDPVTGKYAPLTRYAKTRRAPALTQAKFYTKHLRDASAEDRVLIERTSGFRFQFADDGRVKFSRV